MISDIVRSRAALVLGALCVAVPAASQQVKPPPRAPGAPPAIAKPVFDTTQTTIPFFPLGSSPLALTGDARRGMFVSAVGRKAIAMGTEDGTLELWSWPIKWLHDFELSFRVPKYTAPIPGAEVAERVEERPEGVTIKYAYEQFTVREHVFVPLDKPAVVILLEVDAIRPLDIIATFTPDIQYAWPAGLGGQYLIWEQNARAFLFSEGKRQINAFLGSPAVTRRPTCRRTCSPPRRPSSCSASGARPSATRRRGSASRRGTTSTCTRRTSRSCSPAARCRATRRWRCTAN